MGPWFVLLLFILMVQSGPHDWMPVGDASVPLFRGPMMISVVL